MRNDTRLGIALMVATSLVFAAQDGLSRHLAESYNVLMVVMVRYWFFAAFAIVLARARTGSVRRGAATARPWLQAGRGLLLAFEICVTVLAFTLLGLTESHAAFACYPLLVAALSGPVLGERVGPRRWAAIAVGFGGVLLILKPGAGAFDARVLVPLGGALMFALYGLLTRLAARHDGAVTSFLWTGVAGAAAMTAVGLPAWEPLRPADWALMGTLCVTGVTGHWLLIRAYEVAEAAAVQPFAYLQLPFASAVGVAVWGERVGWNVVAGAAVVVGAGLFTLWRERARTAGPAAVDAAAPAPR